MNLILVHGLGGRSDLPVPLWLALYGGGAAIVLSFAILAVFWKSPKLHGDTAGRPLPQVLERLAGARATRLALRALGLVLTISLIGVAAFGSTDAFANPAPVWFYVWFWVGLVPASLLFGPVWRLLNPLRTLSVLLARVSGSRGGEGHLEIPARVGVWPAAVGLTVFVWLELVFQDPSRPMIVLLFLVLYGGPNLVAASLYGERWFAQGDGFEVYSTLLASMSPLGRRADGRLVVRNPLDGLAAVRPVPGLVAVVAVLLGSTAFDGLTRTAPWTSLTQSQSTLSNLLIGTTGLAGSIVFVAVTFVAASRFSRRFVADSSPGLEQSFVHSLMPIVVGYTLAHYFSLLMFEGQNGYILASDPFARGQNLFGTADWAINYTWVSTSAIALVQVAAIVIGHVVAVISAHDRAAVIFPRRDITRAQYSLLAAMVAYSVGGIALLVGT
ncbi:MAG: hypothetical protein M3333_03505 [Actinomycetota bacterium]|nr:hypothetical protein [Actinomycetota bacterium]